MSNTKSKKARPLGRIMATLLTVSMIVGTGLYTSLGNATAQAGSGILIAMLIGGIIALLTGLSASQVGVNDPEEGGAMIWTLRDGYPTLSFIAGFSYLVDAMTGIGILALGFATYTQQIFHFLPIPIVASVAILLIALINFFGIEPTAKVLIGIFFVNLILLGLYVGLSLPKMNFTNLSPLLGGGIIGVLNGAAIFFWSWDGFQRTAIMADQINEPRKSIPFAVVVGISLAGVIYLIVAATTLSVLGAQKMGTNDIPIFASASLAIGVFGGFVVLASAWITSFSEMLGDLLPASKVAHSMGEENELPRWLGVEHKRFHSPYRSLIAMTIICIALVLLLPIRKLMPVASAFTLFWYIATHFSALKLPQEKHFLPIGFTWVGIVACAGLFAFLPLWSILVALGILAVLAVIFRLFIKDHVKKEQIQK